MNVWLRPDARSERLAPSRSPPVISATKSRDNLVDIHCPLALVRARAGHRQHPWNPIRRTFPAPAAAKATQVGSDESCAAAAAARGMGQTPARSLGAVVSHRRVLKTSLIRPALTAAASG